jgi:hypothetical protein
LLFLKSNVGFSDANVRVLLETRVLFFFVDYVIEIWVVHNFVIAWQKG